MFSNFQDIFFHIFCRPETDQQPIRKHKVLGYLTYNTQRMNQPGFFSLVDRLADTVRFFPSLGGVRPDLGEREEPFWQWLDLRALLREMSPKGTARRCLMPLNFKAKGLECATWRD